MVETKCGFRFLGWRWTLDLTSPFWICHLLPGILSEFSQQALQVTSRQNLPGATGVRAEKSIFFAPCNPTIPTSQVIHQVYYCMYLSLWFSLRIRQLYSRHKLWWRFILLIIIFGFVNQCDSYKLQAQTLWWSVPNLPLKISVQSQACMYVRI